MVGPFEEKGINSDKALGPDDFSMAFYQVCSYTIKEDTTDMFHDFHARSKIEKTFNATFIALIQKKFRAINVQDFCPISLMSGVYKIIAEVLANKLKRVVEK